ncbi:MAG: hypothetical protein K2Y71_08040 [Xanthobacteraceae bacterium]|nr:hypothetical protein [Xanthobacteraceae bacterium]
MIEEAQIGMTSRKRKTSERSDDGLDIGRMLQPANAFADPMTVVDDQDLTLTEKRAILSSWASDARSVESLLNRAEGVVRLDEVMAALKELDLRYGDLKSRPRYRRILENRIPGVFGRRDNTGKPEAA